MKKFAHVLRSQEKLDDTKQVEINANNVQENIPVLSLPTVQETEEESVFGKKKKRFKNIDLNFDEAKTHSKTLPTPEEMNWHLKNVEQVRREEEQYRKLTNTKENSNVKPNSSI